MANPPGQQWREEGWHSQEQEDRSHPQKASGSGGFTDEDWEEMTPVERASARRRIKEEESRARTREEEVNAELKEEIGRILREKAEPAHRGQKKSSKGRLKERIEEEMRKGAEERARLDKQIKEEQEEERRKKEEERRRKEEEEIRRKEELKKRKKARCPFCHGPPHGRGETTG